MIALILAEKIFSLFLIMAVSMLLVKIKLLNEEASKIVSVLLLYMFFPCVILDAFQVTFTPEVRGGIILGTIAAVVIHALFLMLKPLMEKTLKLKTVESCSVIYSNSGNLIIPLVTSVLGPEWVIYTSSFIAVQLVLFWSHCKAAISGEPEIEWRKVVTNPNMVAIFVGLVLLVTGWRFPHTINDAITSVGAMVGPSAMIIAGILLGGIDWKKLLSYKRLPLVVLLRLVVIPLLCLVVLKYSGIAGFVANGDMVLLITLLACSTPSATTVVSMASLWSDEGEYASAINVATSTLCIFTMPIIIALYQW